MSFMVAFSTFSAGSASALLGRARPVSRRTSRRRGVSLLEVIGVLIAAIIILSGAAALAHRAYNDVRVNEALAAVPSLATLTRGVGAQFGGDYPEESLLQELFNQPSNPTQGKIPPNGTYLEIGGMGTADSDYTLTHRVGGRVGQVHIEGVKNSSAARSGIGAWFYISYANLRRTDCLRLLLESPHHAKGRLLGIVVSGAYNQTALQAALKSMILNRNDLSNTIYSVAAGSARFIPRSLPTADGRPGHFGLDDESLLPATIASANTACNSDGLTLTWAFH